MIHNDYMNLAVRQHHEVLVDQANLADRPDPVRPEVLGVLASPWDPAFHLYQMDLWGLGDLSGLLGQWGQVELH